MSDDMKNTKPAQLPNDWPVSREHMDQHIELLDRGAGRVPPRMSHAVTYVHDTMETAWLSARALFGPQATPEQALAIFDRIDAERRRLVAQDEETVDALAPATADPPSMTDDEVETALYKIIKTYTPWIDEADGRRQLRLLWTNTKQLKGVSAEAMIRTLDDHMKKQLHLPEAKRVLFGRLMEDRFDFFKTSVQATGALMKVEQMAESLRRAEETEASAAAPMSTDRDDKPTSG